MSCEYLPVVRRRTTATIRRCPNCGRLPVFRQSDDRYYKTLLVHSNSQCPGGYGLVAYHHSQPEAVAVWNAHVRDRRAARGAPTGGRC